MKSKINIIRSTAVPLPVNDIDTDQIIPARFLKRTEKEGWGQFVFRDWRYIDGDENKPNPDFVLNNGIYTGKILVAGKNFGCGSSREHAVWSIKGYGFDAVVSSMFADIFRNNALNNFLLPVQISEDFLQKIFAAIEADPATELEINLPEQTVTLTTTGEKESFAVNDYKKMCLLNGYDDIEFLTSLKPEIEEYELQHP